MSNKEIDLSDFQNMIGFDMEQNEAATDGLPEYLVQMGECKWFRDEEVIAKKRVIGSADRVLTQFVKWCRPTEKQFLAAFNRSMRNPGTRSKVFGDVDTGLPDPNLPAEDMILAWMKMFPVIPEGIEGIMVNGPEAVKITPEAAARGAAKIKRISDLESEIDIDELPTREELASVKVMAIARMSAVEAIIKDIYPGVIDTQTEMFAQLFLELTEVLNISRETNTPVDWRKLRLPSLRMKGVYAGLSLMVITSMLLTACGAGSVGAASPKTVEPAMTATSEALTEEAIPTASPTYEPTEVPTLKLTDIPTENPTIDPEIKRDLELAKKADEAIRWTEMDQVPEINYEDLDQYMKVLLAKERAVDWDALGRRKSFQVATNSNIVGQPDHAMSFLGSNPEYYLDINPTVLKENPVASITQIRMENDEIVYLLGLPVNFKTEDGSFVNDAIFHCVISDVAVKKWIESVVGEQDRIDDFLEWGSINSIMAKFKKGEYSSIEMYIYNGLGLDKNYDEMIGDRGLSELLQSSINADISKKLVDYYTYGKKMTDLDRIALENVIMVLGRFYLEVRE